jgi:hypothetical protein
MGIIMESIDEERTNYDEMAESPEEQLIQGLANESLPSMEMEKVTESMDNIDYGETPRAKKAFSDYIKLGKGRTLKRLTEEYLKPEYRKEVLGEEMGWTNNYEYVLRKLKEYSTKFNWQERKMMMIAKASAQVLAATQRDAFVHAKERIKLARSAQEAGKFIIDKANLKNLTQDEARKILKQGVSLLQLGLVSERAEQGDMLTVVRPSKPVSAMTNDELDEFAHTLQKALQ